MISLANGDLARAPIASMGGYGYRFTEEAESLRGLFNKTQLTDPEKALILRPELHEVRSPFTTWGALHGDPNTVIEGVMGLSY